MSENTKIEWCDHSWSPWRGCTKVSAGCANCYAETLSKRNPAVLGQWGKGKPRVLAKNWNDPVKWNARADNELDARLAMGKGNPPHEKTSYTVFPSLCDWLDDEVPVEWLARFLGLIYDTPNLNWLLLTKRPENWNDRLEAAALWAHGGPPQEGYWGSCIEEWLGGDPPANVWIGTSVEDQANADRRIPELLKIPAVGRFLSLEPLLGPVDLEAMALDPSDPLFRYWPLTGAHVTDGMNEPFVNANAQRIHWLIVGGESGHGARPCNVEWIRSLVKQGKEGAVATFVKQLGKEPRITPQGYDPETGQAQKPMRLWGITHPKGGDPAEWPEDLRVREFPEGLR